MKSWKFFAMLLVVIVGGLTATVLILSYMGVVNLSGFAGTTTVIVDESGQQVITSSVACTGGETQSADINTHDADSPTTALTEAHNIYRGCGSLGSLGTYTQGTALTNLETGKCYEILFGVDATASSLYDNNYGPVVQIPKLPCRMEKNLPVFQDEEEGSLTAVWYNANHDASSETLVIDTPVIVYLKWYGADKEYYGNPFIGEPAYLRDDWDQIKQPGLTYVKGKQIGYHRPLFPNTLCLALNTTDHREPFWVKAQLQDGSVVEMNRVGAPVIHSATTGCKDYCYEAPIISGTFVEFKVKLDPKAEALNDDTASLYASSFFTNTDTGIVSWGAEDNDGNAVGASGPDTLALDFA